MQDLRYRRKAVRLIKINRLVVVLWLKSGIISRFFVCRRLDNTVGEVHEDR